MVRDVLSSNDPKSGWFETTLWESVMKRAHGGCLDTDAATKDVAACDKLRGGGKQPLIRRFPNGETQPT